MNRLFVILFCVLFISPCRAEAASSSSSEVNDLFFGEALYYAYQERWFDAIARLDTELIQHYNVDEPELDSLYENIHQAEFDVGDFELGYRMHRRAGRAITAVIEGNVPEPVRNEAIFRLSRIYFQKHQPEDALYTISRIDGEVPESLRDNLAFLRAHILMAVGRFANAVPILEQLQQSASFKGFSTYNLAVALMKQGRDQEGRLLLDRAGQLDLSSDLGAAIQDKANLVLGSKLLEENRFESAKQVLDRVTLNGPFSNRALLGSGWADASRGRFQQALAPWGILVEREVTDPSVQEALLALPYAYGKLNVYTKAAHRYAYALKLFGQEIEKLDASINSVNEGLFLKALVREEVKQDANWVVRLRELPNSPETYYLMEIMASHDFQESLKNYLDLEDLRRRLDTWERDLEAFEEIIAKRRSYYEPILPVIDNTFRQLDSRMRLRLEQRDNIEKRLNAMLTGRRTELLATSRERVISEQIDRLEDQLAAGDVKDKPDDFRMRIKRLRGLLIWNMHTDYDRRYTEACIHSRELNHEVDLLEKQYTAFVRARQAATQSYKGYNDTIREQRSLIAAAREEVTVLMDRQGQLIETMAVNELTRRRERLAEFQVKARFALADSYDRASRIHTKEEEGP